MCRGARRVRVVRLGRVASEWIVFLVRSPSPIVWRRRSSLGLVRVGRIVVRGCRRAFGMWGGGIVVSSSGRSYLMGGFVTLGVLGFSVVVVLGCRGGTVPSCVLSPLGEHDGTCLLLGTFRFDKGGYFAACFLGFVTSLFEVSVVQGCFARRKTLLCIVAKTPANLVVHVMHDGRCLRCKRDRGVSAFDR